MRTDAELDYLEKMIPELAESATKKAHLDALSAGQSVTEIKQGKLVLITANGKETLLEDAKPMRKIS